MKRIFVISLVIVTLFALPVMAVEFKIGKFEIENTYIDTDNDESTSQTIFKTTLILDQTIDERVNVFVMTRLDGEFNQKQGPKKEGTDIFVRKGWIDVKDAFGPVDFKAGRMDEAAANNVLYYMKSKYEFARLAYNNDHFFMKAGHNIDDDEKIVFTEFKGTDLGLTDSVTLNYIDADFSNIDYAGYSIDFFKDFDVFETGLTFISVENGDIKPNGFDVRFSTDKLLSGINLSLEYAVGEKGIAVDRLQSNSVFGDSELNDSYDIKIIKPGFNVDLGDRFNIESYYALYKADDSDAKHNYFDLTGTYDLTKSSYLELEYEKDSYDNAGTDESTISTTLGVKF